MKKILLPLLSMLIASYGFAQQNEILTENSNMQDKMQEFNFTKSNKANQSSAWFNYMREISNIASSMPYYRTYLFPDSTVQVEFSSGYDYVWLHSYGQVLDPTSKFFLFDASSISKSANYTLDSVALPYRYRRVQNGPPDTLLIQIFTHNQMTFVPEPGWSTPRSYARVPYDYTVRKGGNPAKEIIVLLDDNDTSTAGQGIIQEAVGITVAPDEKIAATFTYFPGNPFNVDDTIDWYISPLPGKQINSLITYFSQDESATLDNDYYNHSLMATTDIRYNISSIGWNGNYIPGVAWGSGSGNYQADVFFKITYDDFTGIYSVTSNEQLEVYPNPASNEITVEYNITAGNQAILEFNDILGNKVFEQVLDVNGTQTNINVSDWNKGLYFYTLKVDGNVLGTARLVVTK